MSYRTVGVCLAPLLVAVAGDALARIKLVTLPVRERVEIQLDHPQLTLVEEERLVPLLAGVNQVDFSWANTRIDPSTLVFRAAAEDGAGGRQTDVTVLSVSYPPNEQALVWTVSASAAGAARVRISYLLGGLDKQFHYRALANAEETSLTLSQYLRVSNNANEGYPQGEIWAGFGDQLSKPIGLNETKDLLVGKYRGVPVSKTYTIDPTAYGYLDRSRNQLNVPLHYVVRNAAGQGGLGRAALTRGKARIFQHDGRGGVAFLGEDWAGFTPVDDTLELYLGLARDIVVKRTIAANQTQRIAGDLYRHQLTVEYRIENFKPTPARLRLIERVSDIRAELGGGRRDPQWRLGPDTSVGRPIAEHSDHDRLQFEVELPARPQQGDPEPLLHRLQLMIDNEWR